MSESFTVNLESYQGPFDVLLSLISQHQLELSRISLSAITEEFVVYVKNLDTERHADRISSFIDIASILLEAKSASLIPREENTFDADNALQALHDRDLLFARLIQYRAFKQAGEDFRQRMAAQSGRFAHPGCAVDRFREFIPDISWSLSTDEFVQLALSAFRNAPATEVSIHQLHIPLVDLRKQATIVHNYLRKNGNGQAVSFAEIIADTHQTLEIVARFLALLAFFKQGIVQFKQSEAFDELFVRWISDDNDDSENESNNQPVVDISEGDFV